MYTTNRQTFPDRLRILTIFGILFLHSALTWVSGWSGYLFHGWFVHLLNFCTFISFSKFIGG